MACFQIETVVVGPLEVNCYLIGCLETRHAAIIDPGANAAATWTVLPGLVGGRVR